MIAIFLVICKKEIMATAEELFISVSPQSYRRNKSAILMCQSDLLKILRRLQNIKVLSRQKNDCKKQLHKLMTSIATRTKTIQSKIPTPQVPKEVLHHEQIKEKPKIEVKRTFSKRDEIEEELQSIQAKLRELNS